MIKRIIAPSILAADFAMLAQQAQMVKQAGASYLHIDVMDGHFVPNLTLGPCVIKSLRQYSKLFFDVHLMIEHPESFVEAFAQSGADLINVHFEAVEDLSSCLAQIKRLGKKAGITIKPQTPAEAVFPFLDQVDMVLVMTVEPGFGGQALIASCLEKVQILRQRKPELDIEVDGGINLSTYEDAIRAGANVLVAGSAVFQAENPAAVIETMLGVK